MSSEESHYTRVLHVLEQLAATQYPQTLAQLAQRTGLPKTTLMRMLQALEKEAYVTHLPGDLGYVTGPYTSQMATSLLQAPHFLRGCRNILGKLFATTREACNLTAAAGDTVHYLARGKLGCDATATAYGNWSARSHALHCKRQAFSGICS